MRDRYATEEYEWQIFIIFVTGSVSTNEATNMTRGLAQIRWRMTRDVAADYERGPKWELRYNLGTSTHSIMRTMVAISMLVTVTIVLVLQWFRRRRLAGTVADCKEQAAFFGHKPMFYIILIFSLKKWSVKTTEFRPSHNVVYCMINHLYDIDVERQRHRGRRTLRRRDVDKYRQLSMYLCCCNGN